MSTTVGAGIPSQDDTSPTSISPTGGIIILKVHGSGTETGNFYASISGYSATVGEVIHLFYNNATGTSLRIDFGTDSGTKYLHTGSGTAQYLTFNAVEQSASIVCINATTTYPTWAILNAGAAIS